MFFDINKSESYHTVELTESIVFKTRFIGETLNITADNRMTGIKGDGKISWDIVYDQGSFLLNATDFGGNKACVLEKDNIPQLITYNNGKKQKNTIDLESLPDYLDTMGNSVLYNSERIVVFGRIIDIFLSVCCISVNEFQVACIIGILFMVRQKSFSGDLPAVIEWNAAIFVDF